MEDFTTNHELLLFRSLWHLVQVKAELEKVTSSLLSAKERLSEFKDRESMFLGEIEKLDLEQGQIVKCLAELDRLNDRWKQALSAKV